MSVLQKTARRLGAKLVDCGLMSPRRTGFRSLRKCSPQQVAVDFQLLAEARTVPCPLPENVARRENLPRESGRYERSFFDVPELAVGPRWSATLRNVRILRGRDEWGDDFYSLVTENDELVELAGCHYRPEHAESLRRGAVTRRLDHAAWVTTHSTRNHYMWLYTHLPRVWLAQSLGLADAILFPEQGLLSAFKRETLRRLGFEMPRFIQPDDEVIEVGELTLLEVDAFDPDVLRQLRERLAGEPAARQGSRRLVVSRDKCHYRKLSNEAEVLAALAPAGFERVFFEDLGFDEQIGLLAEAEVLIGAHGAGFANVLFCQPGTKVIEIQDPEDANPHFYMLAALLGLPYWRYEGDVEPGVEAHFRDLTLGGSELAEISRCYPKP